MPDTINKQTLINLLIDSPLREPIKINLIDIVNNTTEPDLPKVYSTIIKELEIFQKATERRMKLAEETISKLGGAVPAESTSPMATNESTPTAAPKSPDTLPPLDLPPLPSNPPSVAPPTPDPSPVMPTAPLSVPPLDLPPLPTAPSTPPATTDEPTPAPVAPAAPPSALPTPEPLGGAAPTTSSDEAALAEIQKELESLKAGVAADANPAAPTATPTQG